MLSVFIPTTPNPTTGWYAVVPESEVINLAMSVEDAFKVVISGGIVAPGSLAAAPVATTNYANRTLEPAIEPPLPDVKRQSFSVLPVEEDSLNL
jgi:uncharacterized membrane protein